MRLRSRKNAAVVAARGTVLVMLAVVLQRAGYLVPLESLLYDERVRHCQADRPPPDPSLVHLDVDDNALHYIGAWPWPRATLAHIFDEIALTRPKVLAVDVLLAEPKLDDGETNSGRTDEDRTLAASLRQLGCADVPVLLDFVAEATPSPFRQRLTSLLVADLERTEAQCMDLLRANRVDVSYLDRDTNDSFLQIREAAFHERIGRELATAPAGSAPDPAAIRRALLPHADPRFTGSVLGRLFDEQYDLVMRERAIRRFTFPIPPAAPPLLHATGAITPLLPIARAAAYCGSVSYLPESVEGTVRSVPLLVEYQGRMVPQMGLVAACAVMGVDLSTAQLTATELTLPRAGGAPPVVIPVSVRNLTVGRVGMLMDVPLFGRPRDWLTMYDAPGYTRPVAHLSAYRVYQICQTHDRLDRNRKSQDLLVARALDQTDPAAATSFARNPPTGPAKRQLVDDTLRNLSDFARNLGSSSDLDPDTRQMLLRTRRIEASLRLVVDQVDRLQAELDRQRTALRADLQGRAIFFGGTATGLGDQHPTAMFGVCPGIVVHGAIYNAILTGKMWRRTSPAVAAAVTAGAGLLTLLLVSGLSPGKAFVGSVGLATGYLAFDGYVLFARGGLIVDAAGPTIAVGLVWSGATLGHFLAEISERARITRRFRSYQDPYLVDYIAEHPDHVKFEGERRELTVGFSDIAGFTTLTDELGERVVPLLAEYMGHMVPVIRARGTVLQQMGDGLLFIFGRPRPDPDHAAAAVAAALAMHAALAGFNRTLADRGDRPLAIRVGLATGEVVVGDAGPPDAYTYLALGATTNLAARLESANKFFGTRILITARTAELLRARFLLRPIANLRVAGKLNCTVVYEPLCATADATDQDRRLAACTAEMVDAYRRADFPACARVAAAMTAEFGASKLATLYADRSAAADPDREDHCDGQIVLTEK